MYFMKMENKNDNNSIGKSGFSQTYNDDDDDYLSSFLI